MLRLKKSVLRLSVLNIVGFFHLTLFSYKFPFQKRENQVMLRQKQPLKHRQIEPIFNRFVFRLFLVALQLFVLIS
jgi:hypothetical protein